jgi:hypothetical protein
MKITDKSEEEIQKMLSDAWLNIDVDENQIYNPLAEFPAEYEKNPQEYIAWLMTRPEYFSFLCKEILNVEIYPAQALILEALWNHKFPMVVCSRGWGKSYTLALYAMIRLILLPRRKIAITGAAFRQAKVIFEYMEGIWNNAPLLRDMIGGNSKNGPRREQDMYRFFVGDSVASAYPLGNGDKIRGQRANDIITDEFASINKEILENVIFGFAAVSSAPVDKIKMHARRKFALQHGLKDEISEDKHEIGNQIIISGTAYYQFNHFYEYFKRWKDFINSQGRDDLVRHYFKDGVDPNFNWRDYCIVRVPYELIPEGFMDAGIIARAKATIHSGTYNMEYGACFSKDSTGFFKRSIIESCVVGPDNPIVETFRPVLTGDRKAKYVYGIDPASEVDNFSIVVLELRDGHRRLVYAWSTNKKNHDEKLKTKAIVEQDFYAYCVRKIRDLMKRFPCERIALDSQGGGVAIREAFKNLKNCQDGEQPIYEVIEYDNPKDSDGLQGLHLLELINFASGEWTSSANHGLRKDLENKVLLFPYFDSIEIGMVSMDDEKHGRTYDTLEECVFEIEEVKNELSNIIITKTPNGRDKWDTPDKLDNSNRKVKMRKDRYCSLLMANSVVNKIDSSQTIVHNISEGGFAGSGSAEDNPDMPLYIGPQWWGSKIKGVY